MLAIVVVTVPFSALLPCGYLAVRRAMLPHLAISGLNSFVLYFALPCLLYRFGSSTPLARLPDPRVFGIYLLCALCMVGLTLAFSRRGAIDSNNAAFGADTGRPARIILVSTALSFLSLSGALALQTRNQ